MDLKTLADASCSLKNILNSSKCVVLRFVEQIPNANNSNYHHDEVQLKYEFVCNNLGTYVDIGSRIFFCLFIISQRTC